MIIKVLNNSEYVSYRKNDKKNSQWKEKTQQDGVFL